MIQKNLVSMLAFGFIMGSSLAACATSDNSRKVASDSRIQRECYVGEERDEHGDCVRVQVIERPAHRGGR